MNIKTYLKQHAIENKETIFIKPELNVYCLILKALFVRNAKFPKLNQIINEEPAKDCEIEISIKLRCTLDQYLDKYYFQNYISPADRSHGFSNK